MLLGVEFFLNHADLTLKQFDSGTFSYIQTKMADMNNEKGIAGMKKIRGASPIVVVLGLCMVAAAIAQPMDKWPKGVSITIFF